MIPLQWQGSAEQMHKCNAHGAKDKAYTALQKEMKNPKKQLENIGENRI